MDFSFPPPTPEQCTQAVLGVGVAGGLYVIGKAACWLRRRGIDNLKMAALRQAAEPPADTIPPVADKPPPRDELVVRLLALFEPHRDAEWALADAANPSAFRHEVAHPAGVDFHTDVSRDTAGSDAILLFKVGGIRLFDRTTGIGEADEIAIRQAAWDMVERIVRARIRAAVTKADATVLVTHSTVQMETRPLVIKTLMPQGVVRSFAAETAQIRRDRQTEQEAQEKLSEACAAYGNPAVPAQWVLFARRGDGRGEVVNSCAVSVYGSQEAAAERLCGIGGSAGCEYTMAEFADGVAPAWTTGCVRHGVYKWRGVRGRLHLTEGPARRYEVITTGGRRVFALPAGPVSFATVVEMARAAARTVQPDEGDVGVVTVKAEDGVTRRVGCLILSELKG